MQINSNVRRKLILLAMDWTRAKDPPLSLGHASILTNLRLNGVNVKELSFSVNREDFDPELIVDHILSVSR